MTDEELQAKDDEERALDRSERLIVALQHAWQAFQMMSMIEPSSPAQLREFCQIQMKEISTALEGV